MFKIKNVTFIHFRTVYLYISNLIYRCLFSPDQPPPVFFRHYQVTSRLFDMKREISGMFWCALQTRYDQQTNIKAQRKPWYTLKSSPEEHLRHLVSICENFTTTCGKKKKSWMYKCNVYFIGRKNNPKTVWFSPEFRFFLFSVYVCV